MTTPRTPWHVLTSGEALDRLEASPGGLTDAAAAHRQAEHGPNELEAPRRISPWALLAGQFRNALIVILLAGTALSAVLGHQAEAVAIAAIVLLAVLLGFVQEVRAERAIEALRGMAAPTATVLRGGDEVEIPARELVPGDIVLLRAGDRVPADGRLVEAVNLEVDEAALTGESVPVEKTALPLADANQPLAERSNMVFAGTAATYGRGRALVVATGMRTEFGTIASMLETVETGRTPLQENLDRVGHRLAAAAAVLVALIAGAGLLRGQPFIEMVIFGIALAVAVVPEALPAVVTISLAIGVRRMVHRHALVRRLPAVETLGCTSVICSDKTGTLTKDEMTVREIVVAGRRVEVTGVGWEPSGRFMVSGTPVAPRGLLEELLETAVLASDAHIVRNETDGRWHLRGDPTEGAIVVAGAKAGLTKSALDAAFPRVNEVPFSSEAKRMTTVHAGPGGPFVCTKGAPEIVLDACARVATDEGEAPIDSACRDAIVADAHRMAGSALRVLAVARDRAPAADTASRNLTFLGLVGMIDPPRPEARAAVETCRQAGIRATMITGDHPLTARAVADELGMLASGRVVTGAEIEGMSDDDLARQAEGIAVYARVSPAHKLRVVTALQASGHVVAMTGDGVNDAPALKKADIGVAMGINGTDVTKEAAAMTLTDDNFASIVAAVEEGRGIFGNIKKYLMYLLSSNIGEIGVMAGATLAGLPLPLSAVQILWVNLATDGLPALALAVDPPEADLMRRPPRNPRAGIFTQPVVALMLLGGLWSTAVNLGLFAWELGTRGPGPAMTMTFLSLVLIQFFKAYSFRSDRRSIAERPFANRWLNLAVLGQLPPLALIVYWPALQRPFGTYALDARDWLVVIGLAATVVPVLEIGKWMVRRGWLGSEG